jgi:hypothetical protein
LGTQIPRRVLFTGLLDEFSGAAAAYSLRALSSAWLAGDVVEVRRSSDSSTQGFTAGQVADGTLEAFCGVGDGFVSTWYDQSGNANDATQATTTAQPKIVDAGALVTSGIDFDGVDDSLDFIGALGVGNNVTIYTVLTENDATTRRAVWSVGGYSTFPKTSTSATYDAKQDDPNFRYGDGAIDLGASTPVIQHIATGRPFIANPTLTVNGSTRTGLANARSIQDNSLLIGRGIAGTSTLMGKVAELIVYADATNQTGIENNINDHYSIY